MKQFVLIFALLILIPPAKATTVTDSLYKAAIALPDSLPIKTRIKAFRRVLKDNFKYAPAHNQLAWIYIKQNKTTSRQNAKFAIDRALEIDPDNLDYNLTKGALLWAQGHHQNAVVHYEDVIQKHPNSADANHWLGYYHTQQFLDDKDRQESMGAGAASSIGFDMSSHSSDPILSSLQSRARAAGFGTVTFSTFAENHRNLALKYLRKTLELRPGFRDAVYQVGLIHLESGRPDRLVRSMQYVLEHQPQDKDALLFCGLGYLVEGLPGRAHNYFGQALEVMTPGERTILEDVSLIASKKVQRQFASLEPSLAETWSDTPNHTRFWREQDPLFLTEYNERRLEHYGRLAYANLRYSQPRHNIEGWKTNPGQSYIKYGRYRQRIVRGDAFALTETWIYEGFSLNFRSTPSQGLGGRIFDWTSGYEPPMASPMMRDPWALMDHSEAIDRGEPYALALFRSIENQRRYQHLPSRFPETTKEVFKKTPTRYIDPYKRQRYSLPHLVTAFQKRDSVRLEIAYAVPKHRAKSLTDGNAGIIDGIFLFDNAWKEKHRSPTLVTRANKTSSTTETPDSLQNTYINIQHTLNVAPGDYHVVAEVLDRKTFAIGSFRKPHTVSQSNQFAMSDLLLATDITPRTEFPEARNDLEITPNPLRTFQSISPMYMYLELYNLTENTYGSTKYEIAYQIGRPKEEEIDPSLFFDLDLPEGEIEIQLVDQPPPSAQPQGPDEFGAPISIQSTRPTTPQYEVTYKTSKRNLVTEWVKKNVRGLFKKRHETTITAQYEGEKKQDFTFLQIDLNNVPSGVHKLTVTTRDLVSNKTTDRDLLFRIID